MLDEKKLKKEIIDTSRKLYNFRLAASKGGNLSLRVKDDVIMVTASGSCLGELEEKDILKVKLSELTDENKKGLTTEFPLHSLIYQNFTVHRIIHCHPPFTNAYFSENDNLENITFESQLFLGKVPVVVQNTPNISRPDKVIEALKVNNIAAVRNHGVVCMAGSFNDAFYLIEELEEAVKTAAVARLFNKKNPDKCDKILEKTLKDTRKAYELFSRQHILKIVSLINQDAVFLAKAGELNLTTQVVIKADEGKGRIYKFNFIDGKVEKLEYDDRAPFVISGPVSVWRLVFEGEINPFVAVTQGKLKLSGEMSSLAKWYVPFERMFSLFKEIKIR